MDAEQFVAKLNRIAAESGERLPALDASTSPSSEVIAAWAAFLQTCVKAGIQFSDPRWQQLSIVHRGGATEFTMEAPKPGEPDEDFKVGLQLLMGMLGDPDER